MSCEEITAIETQDISSKGKPQAQRILAEEMTRFVHGEAGLASAERITQALFSGDVQQLSLSELKQLELDGLPCIHSTQQDLVTLLIESGLASSKRIARELIDNNAISVNGEKVSSEKPSLSFPLFDQYWLLQRGKKHFCLVTRAV